MTADMRWKNEAAFESDLCTADEDRLREILHWAASGEARTSSNGRHNSPSTRRGWKARRQAVQGE